MANPFLSNMDNLALLLGAANVGNRNEQLEKQLASAQALRKPRARTPKTGAQATMGGITDALNQLSGFVQENYTQDQINRNLGTLEDPRTLAPVLQKQEATAAAVRGDNPLAAAEQAAAMMAQNPDMAQLALPANPGQAPANAGMGDLMPGGQASQKGRGSAGVDPRLRQPQLFGLGFPAIS